MNVLHPTDDVKNEHPASKVTIASICRHPERLPSLTTDRAVMHKLGVYCDSLDAEEIPSVKDQFEDSIALLSASQRFSLKDPIRQIMDRCFPPRNIPELADQLWRLKTLGMKSNSLFITKIGEYCSGLDLAEKRHLKQVLLSSFVQLSPFSQRSIRIPFEEIDQVCFSTLYDLTADQDIKVAIDNIKRLDDYVSKKPFMDRLKQQCEAFSHAQKTDQRRAFRKAIRTLSSEEQASLEIAIHRIVEICFLEKSRLDKLDTILKLLELKGFTGVDEWEALVNADDESHEMMQEMSLKFFLEIFAADWEHAPGRISEMLIAKCKAMSEDEIIDQLYAVSKTGPIWKLITSVIAPNCLSVLEEFPNTLSELAQQLQTRPVSKGSKSALSDVQRQAFKFLCQVGHIPGAYLLVIKQDYDLLNVFTALRIPFKSQSISSYPRYDGPPLQIAFRLGPKAFSEALRRLPWDSTDESGNNILHLLPTFQTQDGFSSDRILEAFQQVLEVAGQVAIESRNDRGETPLFNACLFKETRRDRRQPLIEFMIGPGNANMVAHDKLGFTPLYYLPESEPVPSPVFQKFLESTDLSDIPESTHFYYLRNAMSISLVTPVCMRKLLEKGLSPNARRIEGNHETILHATCKEAKFSCAKMLIEDFGADVLAKDDDGQSVLDIDFSYGSFALENYLRERTEIAERQK